MLSFNDLIKPIQAVDIKKTLYTLMSRVGLVTTSWKVGAPLRTLTAALSVWNGAYTEWACNSNKLKFLQLSSGPWLDVTSQLDYGTTRNSDQPAQGLVNFNNSTGTPYTFAPEDITVTWKKTNVDQSVSTYTYHNTANFTAAASTTTQSNIKADVDGFASTLPAGAVVTISPQITGLTVTIPTTLLGQDPESDQALANRSQKSTSAISPNGPYEVYEVVALSTLDASGNNVCGKVNVVPGNPVTLIVESPSAGVISGTLNDTTTPLGRLNIAIQTSAVPLGVTAVLENVTSLSVQCSYTAYVDKTSPLSDSQILNYIETSLDELFASFPIGGYVIPTSLVDGGHPAGSRWIFLDSIKSAIQDSTQNISNVVNPVIKVLVATPTYGTADIPMSSTTQLSKGTSIPTLVRT